MAEKQFNIDHVLIQTAKIEIKCITINSKQMTLAVFRQLKRRRLIASDDNGYRLTGVPWGFVNYFWGDLDQSRLHVLFQAEQFLYRDLVKQRQSIPSEVLACSARENDGRVSLTCNHSELYDHLNTDRLKRIENCIEEENDALPSTADLYAEQIQQLQDLREQLKQYGSGPAPQFLVQKHKEIASRNLTASSNEARRQEAVKAVQRIQPVVRQIINEQLEEDSEWNALVQPLYSLPQLFIAV